MLSWGKLGRNFTQTWQPCHGWSSIMAVRWRHCRLCAIPAYAHSSFFNLDGLGLEVASLDNKPGVCERICLYSLLSVCVGSPSEASTVAVVHLTRTPTSITSTSATWSSTRNWNDSTANTQPRSNRISSVARPSSTCATIDCRNCSYLLILVLLLLLLLPWPDKGIGQLRTNC